MSILQVDENKCRRDGICVLECPRRIIVQETAESLPVVPVENEALCLVCGHCVAVCPHGAVSVTGVPLEACPPLNREMAPSWEQAVQFLRSRRSIRIYREEPVRRTDLEKMIETARYAPTAANSQRVHWTVVEGREKLLRLSELTVDWMRALVQRQPDTPASDYFRPFVRSWDGGYDIILRNAPALVVASAPREASNGLVDCTIALTYLELAGLPLGVGTCWAGLLQAALVNSPPAFEALGLPEGHTSHYPMMVGYPKFRYYRLPERKQPPITWK